MQAKKINDDEFIKRIRKTQLSATETIAKHFTGYIQALANYSRLEGVFTLLLLGYELLRQKATAEQAKGLFNLLVNVAKGDIQTTCIVPVTRNSGVHTLSPERLISLRKSASEIFLKHFTGPNRQIPGCPVLDSAYAVLLLAYRFLCADMPPEQAGATFDKLALFAKEQLEAALARKAKFH